MEGKKPVADCTLRSCSYIYTGLIVGARGLALFFSFLKRSAAKRDIFFHEKETGVLRSAILFGSRVWHMRCMAVTFKSGDDSPEPSTLYLPLLLKFD